MTDLRRVREKLSGAARSLAVNPAPLPERLLGAARELGGLESEDLADPEDRRELEEILGALRAVGATGDEGRVAATLAQMDVDSAMDLAQRIIDLEARYRE